MMSYGVGNKKVVFYENEKNHADLKIRLRYDGLTQQQFFTSLIEGYLSSDKNVMNYIFDLKEKEKTHSRWKRNKSKQMYQSSKDASGAFNLDEQEIQDIFDILKEENSDL